MIDHDVHTTFIMEGMPLYSDTPTEDIGSLQLISPGMVHISKMHHDCPLLIGQLKGSNLIASHCPPNFDGIYSFQSYLIDQFNARSKEIGVDKIIIFLNPNQNRTDLQTVIKTYSGLISNPEILEFKFLPLSEIDCERIDYVITRNLVTACAVTNSIQRLQSYAQEA